jgi:hypothetical protein
MPEGIMSKSIDIKAILSNNKEPKFSGELSQTELTQTLSWYAQNRDSKDATKYATEYFKKKLRIQAPESLKSQAPTFGYICRIVSLGGVLNDSNAKWFEKTIEELKNAKQPDTKSAKVANVISIQDHIKRKSSDCIGELEGQIDELITSDFKSNVSPYATMTGMETKGAHTKFIIEHFKTRRAEYDDILTTDDPDVKEAYSNFSKPQLKKLIAYCDQVIVDGMKIAGEAVKSRKPRKRKAKSAEQLVNKLNYAKDFAELKLVSVDPKTIIGANQLWIYNTKTRKLGCYNALDAAGLNIKGSTIQNFAESKSISKTLRKPAVTLPEVLKGGKVALRNILTEIRAAENVLTGRINADTILLRTVK